MISAATIAGLGAQCIDYILGVWECSTGEVRIMVIDDDGMAVPLTIPCQKDETDLAVKTSSSVGVAMVDPAGQEFSIDPTSGGRCWRHGRYFIIPMLVFAVISSGRSSQWGCARN
jgi:hypothetical protein